MTTMTAEQAAESGKDLDFAKVWAAMLKTDEQIKENQKLTAEMRKGAAEMRKAIAESQQGAAEMRKAIAESQQGAAEMRKMIAESQQGAAEMRKAIAESQQGAAEMRKAIAESQQGAAEMRKVIAETSRKVDKVSENLGGLNNTMGKLIEAMFSTELWKKFHDHGFMFTQGSHFKFSKGNRLLGEVDFFLEDGEYVMAVEIKTELAVEDVNEHIERVGKLRRYMDDRQDKRKLIGAVAGGIAAGNVIRYAQKKGFFALVQSGDSIAIAEAPEGFVPKKW